MSHDMPTTPSAQPAKVPNEMPSSFRCGFNHDLDAAAAAAGLTGALVAGGITILRGPAKSGRTTQLVQAAEAVLSQTKDDEVIAIVVPAGTGAPAAVSKTLLDSEVLADRNRGRVDLVFASSISQIVYYIDNTVTAGKKIAGLFIDDLGLIGDTALEQTWKTLTALSFGHVARAFKLSPVHNLSGTYTDVCDEFPVMATIRRQPTQELPTWGMQEANLLVSTDGQLRKSRYFTLPKDEPFYVDADSRGLRTLWRRDGDALTALLVEENLPAETRQYWDRLVATFTG